MSTRSPDPATARSIAIVVVAVALGVLAMGVVMALAMGDMMGGHMRRGDRAEQTPAFFDQAEVAIDISDFDYQPREATLKTGTKVTWTNQDGAPHTATDTGREWDTGILRKGESATLTFDSPGTYEYFCTLHPYMKATLTVS